MIRIKSKYHNFRRCGIAHPKGATEYPDDRFTKQELKILKAESRLIVEQALSVPGDPEAMTVAELRQELQGRDIPTGAKKADLVELIRAARQEE